MRYCLLLLILSLCLTLPLHAQDEPSPYDIASQRIEEARISGATELDLSGLGLIELPPEIGQLTNLEILYLHDNQLSILPTEIGQLHGLLLLHLADNNLASLPSEVDQLSNLYQLWLYDNELTTLPPEIGQLSNLRTLQVGSNNLISLPPEIGQLNGLRHLTLSNNQLRYLPVELGNLTDLAGTEPVCLGMRSECDAPFLDVDNNPLISPPPEVVEQGTAAVLAYLRHQAWYHVQRLIIGAASGVGLLAALVLGWRFRQRRGKSKKKRDDMAHQMDK